MTMEIAYIALGTNIEPREAYLTGALEKITEHEEIKMNNISSIYETDPVGYTDQADFLNMIIEVETTLSPMDLLAYCQGIENRLGRERDIRFGPRTIDLDILLYGEETVSTDELTVPHPRMHERAFVLVPLAELAPSYSIPKVGERVEDLLEKLPEADKKGVRDWSAEDERNDT